VNDKPKMIVNLTKEESHASVLDRWMKTTMDLRLVMRAMRERASALGTVKGAVADCKLEEIGLALHRLMDDAHLVFRDFGELEPEAEAPEAEGAVGEEHQVAHIFLKPLLQGDFSDLSQGLTVNLTDWLSEAQAGRAGRWRKINRSPAWARCNVIRTMETAHTVAFYPDDEIDG
jgi:hypothetical protein